MRGLSGRGSPARERSYCFVNFLTKQKTTGGFRPRARGATQNQVRHLTHLTEGFARAREELLSNWRQIKAPAKGGVRPRARGVGQE